MKCTNRRLTVRRYRVATLPIHAVSSAGRGISGSTSHIGLSLVVVLGLAFSATALAATEKPSPGIAWVTAAGFPAEDTIDAFTGKSQFEMGQVFRSERMPNVVVAVDGTVVATFGTSSVKSRRSEDGGRTWGKEITIAMPGFQAGGLTVDEKSGDILAFVEDRHPPAPLTVYRSTDHGRTWKAKRPSSRRTEKATSRQCT
jgi:photosystem II stability/assembly factor-like uncharacterized protein